MRASKLAAVAAVLAVSTLTAGSEDAIPLLSLKEQINKSPVLRKDHFLDSVEEASGSRWRSVAIPMANGQLMFVRCKPNKCEWGVIPEPKPPKVSRP